MGSILHNEGRYRGVHGEQGGGKVRKRGGGIVHEEMEV